jgi:hypothetical protein
MAFAVRDGQSAPEDARQLLELFCRCVDDRTIYAKNPAAARLLEHVREALQGYLFGSNYKRTGLKGLESAFGLKRKRGRPKADASRNEADELRQMEMAASVLRLRLGGKTHQEAVATTAKRFGWAESIVSAAWKMHRISAVALVKVSRPPDQPWTQEETDRLCVILGDGNKRVLQEIRSIT